MVTKAYVTTMACYNTWQNGQLRAGAVTLDDARRRAEIGLFFGSIMATMNHLLRADRIWLQRFAVTGQRRARPLVVTHFFKHQTHHRGQVHAALTSSGVTTKVADLRFMPGAD